MSMINIAFSGLQAAQLGMNVTSMNTANYLTSGYSRQGIIQSAVGPMGEAGFLPVAAYRWIAFGPYFQPVSGQSGVADQQQV